MGVINVDTRARVPIYEQLCENIKLLVLRGVLKAGEQLPGVRSLASELAINPNTIVKAYNELEREGIIYSLPGRGSFISDNLEELTLKQKESAKADLKAALSAAYSIGVDKNEIFELINTIWEKNND